MSCLEQCKTGYHVDGKTFVEEFRVNSFQRTAADGNGGIGNEDINIVNTSSLNFFDGLLGIREVCVFDANQQ